MFALFEEIARWIYWYPWRKIVQLIPLAISYRLAKFAGYALFWCSRGRKQRTYSGIHSAFPQTRPKELTRMVVQTFQNYAVNSIEVFHYPKLNPDKIKKMVHYEGLEKLDSALQQNKGVILAHGHFGNEEFLMPALGYAGYKLHQIGSRWEPQQINQHRFGKMLNLIRRKAFKRRIGYREQLPVTFHYIDKSLRSAVRVLQKNEVLLFAVDGRESDQWLELTFLGQKALFSPGLARFAKLTGAVVLPVFLIRDKDFSHRLMVENPMTIEEKDEPEIIQEFIALLEQYIRQYPDHYAKVYWLNPSFFIR
jgi:KDO2-lipid IV(A) lauroyltransferase